MVSDAGENGTRKVQACILAGFASILCHCHFELPPHLKVTYSATQHAYVQEASLISDVV